MASLITKSLGAPARPAWTEEEMKAAGIERPAAAPPTALEHIDNVLSNRINQFEACNEYLSIILDRLTGPRPEPPSPPTAGKEAHPGGRLTSINNSCEVLGHQLNKLQEMIEILNRLA